MKHDCECCAANGRKSKGFPLTAPDEPGNPILRYLCQSCYEATFINTLAGFDAR